MWQAEQNRKCPSCGTFDWEWEEDPEAWSADIHWCLGCRSLELLGERTAREALHPEGYKLRLYKGREADDGV